MSWIPTNTFFVQGQSELQIMDIILASLLAQTFIILQLSHIPNPPFSRYHPISTV